MTAWGLLLQRYEHKRRGRLTHHHMASLAHVSPLKEETASGLQSLLDRVTKAKKSLRALQMPIDQWED